MKCTTDSSVLEHDYIDQIKGQGFWSLLGNLDKPRRPVKGFKFDTSRCSSSISSIIVVLTSWIRVLMHSFPSVQGSSNYCSLILATKYPRYSNYPIVTVTLSLVKLIISKALSLISSNKSLIGIFLSSKFYKNHFIVSSISQFYAPLTEIFEMPLCLLLHYWRINRYFIFHSFVTLSINLTVTEVKLQKCLLPSN